MAEKKYEEAKQGYIDAKVAFEKATGAVEVGKKAMSDQVTALVTSMEENWKNLEGTAKKLEKKMKDKKDAWTADAKSFMEGLETTKKMVATDPAGAKAKASELKSIVDRWDIAFKELVAPAKPEAAKK
jgi:hypothetical protein